MGAGALLVDVRRPDEAATGKVPGSVPVPHEDIVEGIGRYVTGTSAGVVLLCSVGVRSALAAGALQEAGFTDVVSVRGGLVAWRAAELPVEVPDGGLSEAQRSRYQRHLTLAEIGEKGQQRLGEARVLIVGAGGLGSPAALYLAAAGVGTLVIVDGDTVDESNLQRQVIHGTSQVGTPKVESARAAIAALNPEVRVETHPGRLTAANALTLMGDVGVVIDGSDNFPTRYLVNDASLHTRVPVVHGSAYRFEGQVSVFTPYDGPCYRCLYPAPPPAGLATDCATVGVLGMLPGVVGTLQATEAVKLLLGIGDPLTGRLLTYDALEQSFMTLRVSRNPDCPACGDETQPPPLVDYDNSCVVLTT